MNSDAQKPVTGELVKRDPAGMMQGQPESKPNVAPIGAEPEPSYVYGFSGMAISPFSQPALQILREQFDPNDVEVKPDGICYLPGVFYRARLNAAFGPGAWALPKRGPARRMPKSGGELVCYEGALFILGRFVSERIGECMYYPGNGAMTYADAYEGAITNCLARCCKDIMPSVEVLWDKGWRDEWTRKYCETYEGKNGKTEWRRKPSLRKSKFAPNVTPITAAGPCVSNAGNAPSVAPGAPPSGPSAPSVPGSPPTEPDANEPADDGLLNELENLAFDTMKWPKDYAGRWLFTNYGMRNPANLTKGQARDAIVKIAAHGHLKGGA